MEAAAIDDLMEDAATAEISRSQLWQWMHQRIVTAEGTSVDRAHVTALLEELLQTTPRFDGDRFDEAAEIFRSVTLGETFPTFLTLAAAAA